MLLIRSRKKLPLILAAVLPLLFACGGFDGDDTPAEGRRLVTGQLVPPDASVFQKQHFALELVAASLDARAEDPLMSFVPGTSFSPSANGGLPVRFRIALPTNTSYVLFFQTPIEGTGGVGHLVAPMRYDAGARGLTDVLSGRTGDSMVPLGDIDLGVVEIQVASSGSPPTYQVILGEDSSMNPLSSSDADGDGTPDLDDGDDDNDLIPDDADEDANGDQIPDLFQSLDALADFDENGIPDRFQATGG